MPSQTKTRLQRGTPSLRRLSDRWTPLAETSPRRAVIVLLVAAVLAVGVGVLIGRTAGYGHLLRSLQRANPWWLTLALPAEASAYAGYVLALRRAAALDRGPALEAGVTTRLVLASLGATRLVIVGGPGILYWGLRRAGLSRAGAALRVLALNVLLYAVFVAAAGLAAVVVLVQQTNAAGQALAGTWLLGTCAAAGTAVGATGLLSLSSRSRRTLGALRHALATRDAPMAIAAAALYWLGDVLCLWAGLRVFHVHVTPDALFLAYATAYLVTMLPVLLGGVGGPEAALALALHAFGAPLAPALLGVLAYRLISFWLPSIPGIGLLLALPRIGDQLTKSSPAADAASLVGPRRRRAGRSGCRAPRRFGGLSRSQTEPRPQRPALVAPGNFHLVPLCQRRPKRRAKLIA